MKAALIPALISLTSLFFVTHFEASKIGLKRLAKEHIPSFTKVFLSGVHYFLVIALLLYEMLVLQHSPQLSVYKAVLLLLGIILLQEIWRSYRKEPLLRGFARAGRIIVDGCVVGSRNMVIVALATAVAGIIIGIVNMGIGGIITQIVEVISLGNVFLLLFFTALACIVLGMGLPTTATYIVMASLTAPIIVELGADVGLFVPLIAAHLFCFYFGILADDTPPVGVAAYTAAVIAKSDPIKTGLQSFLYDVRDAIIPFMFILNTNLLLYNINSVWLGLLIAGMAVLGSFAFTGALQGWLLTRNRWYEGALLFGASLIFLNPAFASSVFGWQVHYYGYLVGAAVLLCIMFVQKCERGL